MNEIEEILAEYRRDMPARLARIEALAAAQNLPALGRELHSLAGSAGTFGLERLGAAARAAETCLESCGASLDAGQRAALGRLLAALRQEAEKVS